MLPILIHSAVDGQMRKEIKGLDLLMPICSCFRDLETEVLNFLVLLSWFMQL